MSNYKDIETEFVERTLGLIGQYESILISTNLRNSTIILC